MRDLYMPLIPAGAAMTATATGTVLDLLIGTNVFRSSIAGVDQVGNMG